MTVKIKKNITTINNTTNNKTILKDSEGLVKGVGWTDKKEYFYVIYFEKFGLIKVPTDDVVVVEQKIKYKIKD